MLTAAGRHGVPVMIYAAGRHKALMRYVRQFDDVLFIVDHCGLSVQDGFGGRLRQPAAFYIDALMPYAPFPNVAVKWSHAPRLSRETYPYRDVTEQLLRMIDTFGVERLMWGSDFTRLRWVPVVGGLAPLPGGIPVVEASYISGLTLFGVPQDQAVVTTLLFRACTSYLPALWGYGAWRSLRRHDLL